MDWIKRRCEFCGKRSGEIRSYRHIIDGQLERVLAHLDCLIRLRGTQPRFPEGKISDERDSQA